MSGVLHSNESQGDSPNKIGLVGSARCDGGGAFVFYRYFSCSFVSARGLRLSGAGGDVGVGYAVLIFEWLTRVAGKPWGQPTQARYNPSRLRPKKTREVALERG